MISSKYFQHIAITLVSLVLILCVLAMAMSDKLIAVVSGTAYDMEYEKELFDTSEIIDVNIIMDDGKWEEMLDGARSEVYYQCDVVINDTPFYQVGIRPKGNTSLSSIASDPNNDRYSFKLEFDQFVDGQTCFGLDKLVLNNSYADTTNMKEAVIYDMFQYLDTDASLYNYAKISVNGEYWGLYLALEAIEESFMLRNYGMEKGYLYKPDSMNHNNNNNDNAPNGNGFQKMPQGEFQRPNGAQNGERTFRRTERRSENSDKTRQPSEKSPQRNAQGGGMPQGGGRMGRGGMPGSMGGGGNLNYSDDNLSSYSTIWSGQINASSDTDHKRVVEALKNVRSQKDIEKYIDVEQVLKYMAVHNFAVNNDSLSGNMAHNYYLYEANGQISILPWDYNLSFGGMNGSDGTGVINDPIDDTWSATRLFDFVMEIEEYNARYHEYYQKLVDEYLFGGKFEETYNRIRSQIDEHVKNDPNSMYTYEEYTKGAEVLKEAVMLRAESVKGQLAGTIPSTTEGQRADASSLVDASHLNLSELGQFMMGGFGGRR